MSEGGVEKRWPKMTWHGRLVVLIGCLLIAGAIGTLWAGQRLVPSCEEVTTYAHLPPRGAGASPGAEVTSGAAPSRPDGSARPTEKLVEIERVETCTPSDLTGGVPLLLAVLGGALIAPGVLRVLPPGKYGIWSATVDTTQQTFGTQALESAAASDQLNAQVQVPGG